MSQHGTSPQRSAREVTVSGPRSFLLVLMGVLLAAPFALADPPAGTWTASFESGVQARKTAKYADAERLLRKAVQEAERFGPQDDRLAKSLNELGITLRS